MNVFIITTSILVMGIIIALGTLTAYKVPVTKEFKQGLMFIILNIAVPSIILNGVFNTEITSQLLHQVLLIFGLSIVYNTVSLLLAWGLAKLFFSESFHIKKMTIVSAFGNTGFIGIPLCATIFGPTGGLLAAVFDSALDLILFTVVVSMLQTKQRFHFKQLKAVLNVPLAAVVFGMVIAVTDYDAPLFARQLTEMLANLAAPLAMLYIGMLIAPILKERKNLLYKEIWFPLSFRLLLMPTLVLIIVTHTFLDELIKGIIIIQAAMPTFTLVTILFSKYAKDEEIAVKTVILSTLLSLITIPIIAFLATM